MKLRLLVLSLPAVCALVLDLPSTSRGIYFPGLTQTAPACGFCHNITPGAGPGFAPIVVALQPTARVLSAGQSIQMALSVTGGQTASAKGGFAADATAGTFSAGSANTSVVPPGHAITHNNSATRSWNFGYTAPAAAGLVEVACIVNTVNDDLVNGPEDLWAFHGFDDTATQVTPLRLYVNATGVVALGASCVGGYRNVPVLGSQTVPAVGNASFALELHGAAPTAVTGLVVGIRSFPAGIDLGSVGVNGCSLYVDPAVTIFGATGPGDAQRAEGTATFGVPIPNAAELLGGTVHFQAFFADAASGRPTPWTFTNALSATIQ